MRSKHLLFSVFVVFSISACGAKIGFERREATPEDTLRVSVLSNEYELERESAELARGEEGWAYEYGFWRAPETKLPFLEIEYYQVGFDKVMTEKSRATPNGFVKRLKEKGRVVGVGDLTSASNSLGELGYMRIDSGSLHCVHFNQFWADSGVVGGVDTITTGGSTEEPHTLAMYTSRINGLYCEESTFPTPAEKLHAIFDVYRVAGLPFSDVDEGD